MKIQKTVLAASIMAALASTSSYAQEEKQEKTQEEMMETINVSSRGLISYVSATGSKSDTPIIETPLSVSVLTEARIQDLGAVTVQDAIGYVAGLYNGPYGVDTRGDWAQIRGVAPVQYLDGLKSLFGNYNNVRVNPYSLGQIEVLKGPSSVLYGQGSTGGIINLVSKRPKAETEGQFWAQLGNYSRKQVAGDITGALNDDASLTGRFVGLYRDSDTQTDYVPDNSLVLNPSLSWHASEDTKITLIGNIQRNESGSSTQFFPWQGTLLPNEFDQIDSSTFVSEPGFDKYDTEQDALTAIVEHDINLDWSLRLASRYSDSSSEYNTMYGWPPVFAEDNRTVNRVSYLSRADARAWTTDLQLHGNLNTGAVEHDLVFGIDFQDAYTDNDTAYGAMNTLDLYNPVYGQATGLPTEADLSDAPSSTTYQLGVYVQDNMRIADKWLVSAALRRDRATTNPEMSDSTDQYATTGRLGFMYLMDGGVSPYVSYSESFSPVLGTDAFGKAFVPNEGKQWEAGVKYQPEGTEHLLTASVYKITEENRTTSVNAEQAADPDIVDPNGQVQTGEVEIEGVELEAQLAWDSLDVYASYAYTDAVVSESNTVGEEGATLSATPDQQASVWATYRPDNWNGFKIGAGVRYVGNTSDGSAYVEQNGVVLNDPLETPSYTVFDAMIGYDWDNYSLSLDIDNLTDKTVLTSCLSRGDCFYGQQRTIMANFRYNF
ncbi:iron complex outermembrane receptor protein [Idiomarina loihiensis]|uniref:TonB-dependent siderophore receptor n=1 Tax=Idiomarina TaxID=135575 RepID=UPI000D714C38|nr:MULTISPECIES: TonB-dependent siderophore receptor [Idiomarina]PWW38554.1 iron complex outermembrane receptor protein [Idiomarina loihiensis]TDP48372.1 iron complex outermembrane receptor protein [Idiomarina loihiensis]TDS23538.1 iron complex outermembrane receptor protein [Idiomarina sp. H2]